MSDYIKRSDALDALFAQYSDENRASVLRCETPLDECPWSDIHASVGALGKAQGVNLSERDRLWREYVNAACDLSWTQGAGSITAYFNQDEQDARDAARAALEAHGAKVADDG